MLSERCRAFVFKFDSKFVVSKNDVINGSEHLVNIVEHLFENLILKNHIINGLEHLLNDIKHFLN
jgi:hypothetical protein